MIHLSCVFVALLTGVAGYVIGSRRGFHRGLDVASHNSSNLITQLKNANEFATDLREEDRAKREKEISSKQLH